MQRQHQPDRAGGAQCDRHRNRQGQHHHRGMSTPRRTRAIRRERVDEGEEVDGQRHRPQQRHRRDVRGRIGRDREHEARRHEGEADPSGAASPRHRLWRRVDRSHVVRPIALLAHGGDATCGCHRHEQNEPDTPERYSAIAAMPSARSRSGRRAERECSPRCWRRTNDRGRRQRGESYARTIAAREGQWPTVPAAAHRRRWRARPAATESASRRPAASTRREHPRAA